MSIARRIEKVEDTSTLKDCTLTLRVSQASITQFICLSYWMRPIIHLAGTGVLHEHLLCCWNLNLWHSTCRWLFAQTLQQHSSPTSRASAVELRTDDSEEACKIVGLNYFLFHQCPKSWWLFNRVGHDRPSGWCIDHLGNNKSTSHGWRGRWLSHKMLSDSAEKILKRRGSENWNRNCIFCLFCLLEPKRLISWSKTCKKPGTQNGGLSTSFWRSPAGLSMR